jgi:hypothetical protein
MIMKRMKRQLLALAVLGSSITIGQAQSLTAPEVELATGQTVPFVVNLTNGTPDTYNALTLTLLIPDGFSIADDVKFTKAWSNPFCVTDVSTVLPDTIKMKQYDSAMFWAMGDMSQERELRIAVASASELPGTAVDSLLTFSLTADKNAAIDDYFMKLQNVRLESAPKGKHDVSSINVRINLYPLGDANRSKKVDVADATLIIAHIMGYESTVDYNPTLADMNSDKEIDVFDIMKLVNVILTGRLPEPAKAPAHGVARFCEDMQLAFTHVGMTMGIPDAQRFTSFQFEVEVPDGAELNAANLTDNSTNHSVQYYKIDDNHYRVVGLSMNNSLFNGNLGNSLIELKTANCDKFSIRNAMFVTPRGEITYFQNVDIESGITGIRGISHSSDEGDAYDLLGRKVLKQNGRLPKGVYIINHKRVVIK